jgi:hypothetical protein
MESVVELRSLLTQRKVPWSIGLSIDALAALERASRPADVEWRCLYRKKKRASSIACTAADDTPEEDSNDQKG